jgi:NADH-quinone oxidoreductase subunit M
MNIGNLPILTIVTFTPLVGAFAVAVAPGRYARGLALAASLVAWGLSLLLLIAFNPHSLREGGFQLVEHVDWIPLFGIQYKVGIDGLSLILVVLTTTLSWISILASFSPIKDRIK